MTTRGIHKDHAAMVTTRMLGAFADRTELRQEFLAAISGKSPLRPIEV